MLRKLKFLEVYIDNDDYRTLQYYCLFCKNFIDHKENAPFEHIQYHLNETENKCVVCNVKFIEFHTFIKHMKSNCGVTTTTSTTTQEIISHKSIKKYSTNKINCSSSSSTNNGSHRQYSTSLTIFKCLYCNQEFSSAHDRLKHITNHLQTSHTFADKYSKSFNDRNDFDNQLNSEHTKRKHVKLKLYTNNNNNNSVTHNSNLQKTDNNNNNNNISIIENITIEKKRSSLSSSWIISGVTNHENNLNVTNTTITDTPPQKKTKTIDDYFICHICGWRFTDRRNLRTHFVVHTRERNHECKVCHKRFSVAYTVKQHMRIHTGEKPFPCKLCNKKYYTSGLLTKHVNDAHTRIKRHQCVYCDKKFMRKEYLQAHIRTHTGERPYTCDLCNTSFTKSSTMRTHRRLHTGEKPYQCGCGKFYAQRAGLYGHMKTHKHVEMKRGK